jgi:RND family efflux transporter MFP subunit
MNRKTIVIGGLVAALAAVALTGCSKPHAQAAEGEAGEVLVRTALAEPVSVARPVLATGLLAGKEEVPLGFKTGGVVQRIGVEAGDRVRAGQALAWLDPAEIGAMAAKAQAGADKADRDLARARALFADSVITRQLFDDAQTARDAAHADLAAARFNARTASITAPADGVVLRRLAEPGETVGPGMPVLVYAAAGLGQVVRVGVADRDVSRLAPGDAAALTFDATPGRTWAGRVTRIGAAASPGTGTYEVEVRLAEPVRLANGGGLASGLVADVTIRPAHSMRTLFVPVEAVLEGDGERANVWVLGANGQPEHRAVRIAWLDGDRAAIAEGLAAGERVVTDGAAYLQPGSRVKEAAR